MLMTGVGRGTRRQRPHSGVGQIRQAAPPPLLATSARPRCSLVLSLFTADAVVQVYQLLIH